MMLDPIVWVIVGGFLEPLWVVGLKEYDNRRSYVWLALAIAMMFISPMCIGMATDAGMQVGVAYSIWTGLGATFTMLAGFLLYKEKVGRLKIFFVMLILIGIVGIQMTSGGV